MDYFSQFLLSSISSFLLELIAALTGTIYILKKTNKSKLNNYLAYFLWFTLFFDTLGGYVPIAYFSKFKYFGFIKNTPFQDNYWWFNMYMIISFSFFIYYFNSFIKNKVVNKRLNFLTILFLIATILNLLFSDVFFNGYSIFTNVTSSVIVMVSIFLYYFDLLRRDDIISLKKQLPVYISIGVLIYNLMITPSDIYSQYFNSHNDLYVKLSGFIVLLANIIMYGAFIIGFIVCGKIKKKINFTLL